MLVSSRNSAPLNHSRYSKGITPKSIMRVTFPVKRLHSGEDSHLYSKEITLKFLKFNLKCSSQVPTKYCRLTGWQFQWAQLWGEPSDKGLTRETGANERTLQRRNRCISCVYHFSLAADFRRVFTPGGSLFNGKLVFRRISGRRGRPINSRKPPGIESAAILSMTLGISRVDWTDKPRNYTVKNVQKK